MGRRRWGGGGEPLVWDFENVVLSPLYGVEGLTEIPFESGFTMSIGSAAPSGIFLIRIPLQDGLSSTMYWDFEDSTSDDNPQSQWQTTAPFLLNVNKFNDPNGFYLKFEIYDSLSEPNFHKRIFIKGTFNEENNEYTVNVKRDDIK